MKAFCSIKNKIVSNLATFLIKLEKIVSLILSIFFLIYIRDIFSEINSMQIRSSNYVDNIELVASSKTIKENYLMLENTAEKLLQLQN